VGDHRCVICHEEKKELALHIPYHPIGEMVCTDCHMPTLAESSEAEYNFDFHNHTFWPPDPRVTVQYGGQEIMPNACNLCHTDKTPEWATQAIGLEIEAVSVAAKPTVVKPPTPVPSATPFLGLVDEELAAEAPRGGSLLLWVVAGLGLLAVVVVLILASQRQGRGKGREV